MAEVSGDREGLLAQARADALAGAPLGEVAAEFKLSGEEVAVIAEELVARTATELDRLCEERGKDNG